jgi:hypothetical protein
MSTLRKIFTGASAYRGRMGLGRNSRRREPSTTAFAIRNITDPGGIGYDDFSFRIVREPGSAILLCGGLIAIAHLSRLYAGGERATSQRS